MVGGEARYDRFTIMTDLVYANASITTINSHFSSVNLGLAPIDIPGTNSIEHRDAAGDDDLVG